MERLNKLFRQRYGVEPENAFPLTGSASARQYYRMCSGGVSCIGVVGTDKEENAAFVALARHF